MLNIDNLTYSYTSVANRLITIKGGNANVNFMGGAGYNYDLNDDRMVPIENWKLSATKALNNEGTVTNWITAKRDSDLGLNLLDYGARCYDASIGRWTTVDPMIEKYFSFSPYTFSGNNPILLLDPNGMEIVNPYEQYADMAEQADLLQADLANAKASKDKKAIKQAKNNLKAFGKDNLKGVQNYKMVKNLLEAFKNAVGEEEYNYLDNLNFGGKEVDIVVGLSEDEKGPDSEVGRTNVEYKEGNNTDYSTGKTTKFPSEIKSNTISITLYRKNLRTLSNELGDAKFAVEQAQTVINQRKLPYYSQSTTHFSFDYEEYVEGKKPKPNSSDKKCK